MSSRVPPSADDGSIGILYLENNSFSGAFTDERLQMIRIMISQMCVSIENAQNVGKLTEASLQLRQKNDELKQADHIKDRFLAVTSHGNDSYHCYCRCYCQLFAAL